MTAVGFLNKFPEIQGMTENPEGVQSIHFQFPGQESCMERICEIADEIIGCDQWGLVPDSYVIEADSRSLRTTTYAEVQRIDDRMGLRALHEVVSRGFTRLTSLGPKKSGETPLT